MGRLLDKEKIAYSLDGFGFDVLSDARDDVPSSGVTSAGVDVRPDPQKE
jgi:hypothetical protein